MSGDWNSSSHSFHQIFLHVCVHIVELQLVLVLNFLDGGNNVLSRSERLGLYAVKLLIQIEVNVTHFEVVASDLDFSGENTSLKRPNALPFSRPKGLELGVEATKFNDLVVFSIGTLCDLEQDLSWLEAAFAILLCLSNQVISQLACWDLHGLLGNNGTFQLIWIKAERDTLGAIVVGKVVVNPSVGRDHDNLAIWQHDVLSVSFVPGSQRTKDLFVLHKDFN